MRNGDRWQVTAIHSDRTLAASRLDGRGHVVLPADYAAEYVALAYAVTIHKAQGVTVDHAICLIDSHSNAEGLYVGMTRGRASNIALAVTDTFDADQHHRRPELRDAADVMAAALARPAAELSATETLRRELARTESLDHLAPRLVQVNALIDGDCPPDRSIELQRLADQRTRAQARLRPGWWTSTRRDHRRALDRLDQRLADLEADQQQREGWLTANAELLVYRDQLAGAVAGRRHDLGRHALKSQPEHLTRILGPVPDQPSAARNWQHQAARIEAYREEWSVSPDGLGDPPADGVQYRAWADTVRIARDLHRVATRSHSRSIERDHGLELGR